MSKPHEREHKETFAEGQARDEHHPEKRPRGDFAKGQDEKSPTHEGTFAEGQARDEHHPERDSSGRYSEGRESDDKE